ncbi:MAG: hypothetical protein NZO58_14245, partial [Gemmataceae bacterium]|nr:hypothetical protein [Gemmataceae bacterium]
ELIPDPQSDHYRLTAELCHRHGDHFGRVGLYLARRDYRLPAGKTFVYTAVCFNDLYPTSIEPVFPNKPVPPRRVTFETVIDGPFPAYRVCHGPTLPFVFAGVSGDNWRRIVVTVRPLDMSVKFDDRPLEPLTFGAVGKKLDRLINDSGLNNNHAPGFDWLEPHLSPRGGLGILVFRGSVAVRNVVLEPLNP